jgi:hypothetical protein
LIISSLLQHQGLAQVAESVKEDTLSSAASSPFCSLEENIKEKTANPISEVK